MARIKQYDKGYLEGSLDSAEGELWALRTILDSMVEKPATIDLINVRIRDTEKYLLEHGRSIDVD